MWKNWGWEKKRTKPIRVCVQILVATAVHTSQHLPHLSWKQRLRHRRMNRPRECAASRIGAKSFKPVASCLRFWCAFRVDLVFSQSWLKAEESQVTYTYNSAGRAYGGARRRDGGLRQASVLWGTSRQWKAKRRRKKMDYIFFFILSEHFQFKLEPTLSLLSALAACLHNGCHTSFPEETEDRQVSVASCHASWEACVNVSMLLLWVWPVKYISSPSLNIMLQRAHRAQAGW